jgi:hemerythrin-like metal-binding protein
MLDILEKADNEKVVSIAWKDFYSVGNEELDHHHKTILSITNDLYHALRNDSERQVVQSILDRLVEYADFHFTREEELMEECRFPDLANHKVSHQTLAQKTNELRLHSRRVKGKDLLRFVKAWWVNHICREDKQYSSYMDMGRLAGTDLKSFPSAE